MITNKNRIKKTERVTCQKKIILDYLKTVNTHPSAEIIYSAVKKKLPRLSRGTVYRNLKNLKEKGEIIEIPHEVNRYDDDMSSHAHFICQNCDKISDIFDACKECKVIKRKRVKFGKIQKYNIYFYGFCKNCRK